LDDRAVGAEVAAEPRGFAGEHVGSGECTGATEIAPGTDQPPCDDWIDKGNGHGETLMGTTDIPHLGQRLPGEETILALHALRN
jgi:hypothetical protein